MGSPSSQDGSGPLMFEKKLSRCGVLVGAAAAVDTEGLGLVIMGGRTLEDTAGSPRLGGVTKVGLTDPLATSSDVASPHACGPGAGFSPPCVDLRVNPGIVSPSLVCPSMTDWWISSALDETSLSISLSLGVRPNAGSLLASPDLTALPCRRPSVSAKDCSSRACCRPSVPSSNAAASSPRSCLALVSLARSLDSLSERALCLLSTSAAAFRSWVRCGD